MLSIYIILYYSLLIIGLYAVCGYVFLQKTLLLSLDELMVSILVSTGKTWCLLIYYDL
jgi:hypothetical protein